MSKPEFVDGLKRIFDWTTKNWKLIAVAGAGLLALNIAGTAATLFKICCVLLIDHEDLEGEATFVLAESFTLVSFVTSDAACSPSTISIRLNKARSSGVFAFCF